MDILECAKKIADKYVGENYKFPGRKWRAFYDGGIRRGADYRYHADMNAIFPEAKMWDEAFVRCLYMAEKDEVIGLSLTLFGPTTLTVNFKTVFSSNVFTERNNHLDNRVDVRMRKGMNVLNLRMTKTPLGFGCIFGTSLGKWDYIFMTPDDPEVEGCQYRLNDGPWLPKMEPLEEESLKPGEYALFVATDGEEDFFIRKDRAEFPSDDFYKNYFGVEGHGAWMGLWPLREEVDYGCFPFWIGSDKLFDRPTEGTYWRFNEKNLWLRPYYGNGSFGRWSYPLGVALYGLLRLGRLLNDERLETYVADHVKTCLDDFDYALWDKKAHGGAASLHNLLCSIDSLDDCGAFGALVEEAALSLGVRGCEKVCDYIFYYMKNFQPRLENGAFYRNNQLHSFHNETMWLDDLYMSVPFLCRRYKLTGDEEPLYDAVNQLRRYMERLYMEEEGLMSHVYDLRHGLKNEIPWGRGNGWLILSLSELLTLMPADFPARAEMEERFRTLCASYARWQSDEGRWHQVLNDPSSYLETSCTAMFACAFMRGVRMGVLDKKYAENARRAVNSIVEDCVDKEGNVRGVCPGSEFSFDRNYYKTLEPRTNDIHGIGVVLLAICEVAYGA